MRAEASREIDTIASSVADGSSIDWGRTAAGLGGRERRLISHLRVVDAVAHVYRSLPPSSQGAGEDSLESREPAGPRWGRLILLDRTGRGASADVFRAWDVDLEREVALKLLVDDGVTADASANARLLLEARRIARIRHPNVVHVYGAERHEGRVGLWMEFVRGRTLAQIVESDGVLAPAVAAAACADVCGAVSAVHAAGLLHRDIKAQNVVRDEAGRTVLMDFGAGAEIGSRTGVAGTPIYLAPEVLAGQPATVASDIYSLGVLVYFLLTGRYPVQATSVETLAAAHAASPPIRLTNAAPAAPAAIARAVDRALERDPAKRFASAAEMESALRACVAPPVRSGQVASWRTWTAVVATAAVVAMLVTTAANWRLNGSATAAPATSIAVLPLAPASGEPESAVLADGLTGELITRLAAVRSLRVTAHTSVRQFTGAGIKPPADIASELHVGSFLQGTVGVTSSPDPRVQVKLRLIRAGTGVDLWSDSFDRPLGNLSALEGDIARAVVRGVGAALSATESTRLSGESQHDPRAEQAYLQARSYLAQNRQGEEVMPAVDALKQAIAFDPDFADPHAALARAYVLLGFGGAMPQREAYVAAKREAERALELDSQLPDAHIALADVSFYYEWDWTGADAEYRQAIALAPGDSRARSQYSRLLAALGRTDEAAAEARLAAAADPLNADATLTQGLMSYYQRRFDDAQSELQRALQMDPRFPGGWVTLSRVEEARGNFVEAGRLVDRALAITTIPSWRADRIRLRALAGDKPAARKALQALEAELAARGASLDDPHRAYIHIALGDVTEGLELLSTAVLSRDPSVLWMGVDPRLDRVRNDPRFQALLWQLRRP